LLQNSYTCQSAFFSFFTGGGTGFEAFFTAQCVLVVAVVTKKDYHAVSLPDNPLNDQQWVCLSFFFAILAYGELSCGCHSHRCQFLGRPKFGRTKHGSPIS
jgi:hypothetical protein